MTFVDILVTALLLLGGSVLVASVVCTVRWKGRWRLLAAMPLVCLLAWAVSVMAGWPVDHTLWPLELVLALPAILLYMLLVWVWRDRAQA